MRPFTSLAVAVVFSGVAALAGVALGQVTVLPGVSAASDISADGRVVSGRRGRPALRFAPVGPAAACERLRTHIDSGTRTGGRSRDYTGDGNVNQDDVNALIACVSGDCSQCQAAYFDPDFNYDGNVDQQDIVDLIAAVASGVCP